MQIGSRLLALAFAGACLSPVASAEAFWAARGPRGAVAVGAPLAGAFVRPPVVAGGYYARGCLRCAPYYAPGAVAAGAAIGAAAAVAAERAAAPSPVIVAPAPHAAPPHAAPPHAAPPSAAPPVAAAPSSSPPAPPPQAANPPPPAAAPVAVAAASTSAQPACASKLSQEARLIYNASHSAMTPSANLKDVVTAQTRALVMSGKVQMSSARNSATSAGECLAQAQ